MLFVKFKSQHTYVFQDWKHILFLTADDIGANENRMFTEVDISVLRVENILMVVDPYHRYSTEADKAN